MNRVYSFLILCIAAFLLYSCSASKQSFSPFKKYPVSELQEDYRLFRNILEETHPSLYWFTPKDSMNYYFDYGYGQIRDSMTEPAFKTLLSYIISKIRCGHTSVRYSRLYSLYLDTAKLKTFPLSMKVWPDSMAVVANLNRKDNLLKRGTIIKSIDGHNTKQLTDTFFQYLITDGNALIGKYQTLSSRGSFGSLYRNVFGLKDTFLINFIDSSGNEKQITVPIFDPLKDTGRVTQSSLPGIPRIEIRNSALLNMRSLQIDTLLSSAYMTVNTFSRGNKLRPFFKESFQEIHDRKIHHLVIDVRANGGGDAGLSTLLTEYLIDKKFKLADSLYASRRSSKYGDYIQKHYLYWMVMQFITRRKSDGKFHFGYFERHFFGPKKKFHFDGNIYIITGGNSFSATTLFIKNLKGQKNVLVVGEETGGGAYGNTAWMIPDVTLPNTKIRFRLPKFRLVMDRDAVKEGRGIIPDIEVSPTAETIRLGIDPKTAKVKELIMQKNSFTHQ